MPKPRICSCSCIICHEQITINSIKTHYNNAHQKMCVNCGQYTNNLKFCSHSCSASYLNKLRGIMPIEIKGKISLSMSTYHASIKGKTQKRQQSRRIMKPRVVKFCKISWCNNCGICIRNSDRKTCSISCRDQIRSKNGTLKRRVFYKTFIFQSTWEIEIAKFLDYHNIIWEQPHKRLKWFDTTTKTNRTYLPDFLITDHKIYLDVKNPFKQIQDAGKLKQLKSLFPLFVGDIQQVKDYLVGLEGLEPPTTNSDAFEAHFLSVRISPR